MNVILDYWNRRWQSVAFDPARGNGHVRWFRRNPKQPAGWALHYKGGWYAIRKEGQDLVFQAGTAKWPMNDEFRCRNDRRGPIRLFTIRKGDAIEFQIEYDVPSQLDEPTVDQIDLETTDFFYWVARLWNDAGLRAGIKAAWRGPN